MEEAQILGVVRQPPAGTPTRLQAPCGKLPPLSFVSSLQRASTAIAINNGAVQWTNTFSTRRSALVRRILMHAAFKFCLRELNMMHTPAGQCTVGIPMRKPNWQPYSEVN